MAKKPTKFERLARARVIDAKHFTEQEKKVVNRLTEREVNALIRMRGKRGPTRKGREKIRPNIFV